MQFEYYECKFRRFTIRFSQLYLKNANIYIGFTKISFAHD